MQGPARPMASMPLTGTAGHWDTAPLEAESMLNARKIIQGLIIAVIVGLSVFLAAGVWKGKVQQNRKAEPTPVTSDAEMKLTDMEFTEMQQGKRFWTLHAEEAKYFQEQQKTSLKAVHLVFYLDDKGEEMQLDGKEGIFYAGTKNIELREEVRATLPRGYVVTTTKAVYDQQKRLISADEPIRLTGPGIEVEGNRWAYSISENTASLDGGVKASLVGAQIKLDKKP